MSLQSCSYSADVLYVHANQCVPYSLPFVAMKVASELTGRANMNCISYTAEEVKNTVKPYMKGFKTMASREGIECTVILTSIYANKTIDTLKGVVPEHICTQLKRLSNGVMSGSQAAEESLREKLLTYSNFPKTAIDHAQGAATVMRALSDTVISIGGVAKQFFSF